MPTWRISPELCSLRVLLSKAVVQLPSIFSLNLNTELTYSWITTRFIVFSFFSPPHKCNHCYELRKGPLWWTHGVLGYLPIRLLLVLYPAYAQSQLYHFSFTMDCCWASLTLWLGRSNRIQLMMGSSGCKVTCSPIVKHSVPIRIQSAYQEPFFKRCTFLCWRLHSPAPEH